MTENVKGELKGVNEKDAVEKVTLDSGTEKIDEGDVKNGDDDSKTASIVSKDANVADIKNPEKPEDSLKGFPPAAIAGLLQACGQEMTSVEQELKDLTGKQNEMYEKIREHNQMLESSLPLDELSKLFDNMKVGLDKLQSIRQEMFSIHERSAKLKERAAKLSGMRRTADSANEDLIAVVNLEDEAD